MAQANFTPIQLYRSTTASAVPTSGNLADGELAINTNDGKLYYKDSGGTVQLIASKAGASGDVVGPASATDNAVVRFDGTTGKLVQNSVVTIADSTGDVAGVGALTASGNLTLSGGTANGVLYLNGSKVATSGSALVFDGTNLGIGTSSPASQMHINANADNYFTAGLRVNRYTTTGQYVSINYVNGLANIVATDTALSSPAIRFLTSTDGSTATEQMRLTSTGLGIGTSSPTQKLTLVNNAASTFLNTTDNTVNTLYGTSTGLSAGLLGTLTNHPLVFYANNGEKMRLDSSGNLGLGVTPSAWDNARTAFQIGNTNSYFIGSQNTVLGNNAYNDGTNWKYLTNYNSTLYTQSEGGNHSWYIAPAGTAGNNISFTQAMTLDASGNLLVGTTSQFLSEKLSVDTGNTVGIGIKTTGGASNSPISSWNATTTGDAFFAAFATETSITVRGSITYNRVGGLVAYNTTSDYRAKDILGPVANSGATIDALKVYNGKMKGATVARPMLIAHEAQEITPYAVTGEKDAVNDDGTPKYQQMDVSSFVPLLIAEIQSLRQRVAQLEGA